jgi:hypothetical protein
VAHTATDPTKNKILEVEVKIYKALLIFLVLSLLSIQPALGQRAYNNVSGHINGYEGLGDIYMQLRIPGGENGHTIRATILSDSSGNYTFYGLDNGEYSIQPALGPEYEFIPGVAAFTVSGAHITGLDFLVQADQPGARIYGTITGPAAIGATITLGTDPQETTLTDSTGYYVFLNISAGTYTLEPSLTGCTFASDNPSITATIIAQEYDRHMPNFVSSGECNILFLDSFE